VFENNNAQIDTREIMNWQGKVVNIPSCAAVQQIYSAVNIYFKSGEAPIALIDANAQ
jgi:hypothetical protein